MLGLGVNTRVLMIGAHPDDEDTNLIAWLSRGRHVTTAYLSLTRGDGGQNLIGNELGEALGVIRTEELLAARRIDGAQQFFTRAFDFGFSKDTIDTYKHWPKDSILGDVVRVVRAFRPHVIVAVFSGTTRDGHGQHQVSGLLAREAYDVAADTARFPVSAFGTPWTTSKFYRAARGGAQQGAVGVDVGEYSPLLGRSYAEIAGESRSEHKSQGFGALQRKGPVMNYVRREATRVNESTAEASERSMFDGIDTTWARFRPAANRDRSRAALDSLPAAFAAAAAAFNAFEPSRTIAPLARAQRLLNAIDRADADFEASRDIARTRVEAALADATGTAIDVAAEREANGVGGTVRIVSTIYNRSGDTLGVQGPASVGTANPVSMAIRFVPPGGILRDTLTVAVVSPAQPWWLVQPRDGAMFSTGSSPLDEESLHVPDAVDYHVTHPRTEAFFKAWAPIVYRVADQVKGEIHRLIAGVPVIAVTLDQETQFAPANADLYRELNVHLRSADLDARVVRVTLALPKGLAADSAMRTVRLGGYDARQTVTFRIRGRLPAGEHRIAALAESDGVTFTTGYDLIEYDHIRRQRIYRPAEIRVSAVDVRVPATLRVGYIAGVGDNVAPALTQLGIPVTVIPARDLARAPLSGYTAIVVGPRAYEAHAELVAANARLLDFARKGGTVVVQYGQYEMTQPGIMPYAITLNRPHDRVTQEDAPVTILDPPARELTTPNRIRASDFTGWVQERSLYMPRTFDAKYRALLAMNDPGEPPNRGAILVAPVGKGLYIYTTLAFFRQLPAGVPGAARLFVNLLSAGIPAPRVTP